MKKIVGGLIILLGSSSVIAETTNISAVDILASEGTEQPVEVIDIMEVPETEIEVIPTSRPANSTASSSNTTMTVSSSIPAKSANMTPIPQRVHVGPFEGPAVYLGLGYSFNEMEEKNIDNSLKVKENTTDFQIGAEYGIPVGKSFIVTLGANYNFTPIKYDSGLLMNAEGTSVVNTTEAKMKNRGSFYAGLGYKILPDLMAYGKVGYHYATGTYADKYSFYGQEIRFGSDKVNFSGIGVGAGMSYMINANFESGFEVGYVQYNKHPEFVTTGKPNSIDLSVKIKYRF